MAASPFTVVGKLAVVESATVICLRNAGPRPAALPRSRFGLGPRRPAPPAKDGGGAKKPMFASSVDHIFGDLDEIDFSTGWEVLMGQSECVNWVRSTGPDKLKFMRYAGEYKFAGGNLDDGETFIQAAGRELEEEFLRPAGLALPKDAVIRPFVVKQTMPVQSKSNIMWNMVALAEENPWLSSLDVDAANERLVAKRRHFETLLASGAVWGLGQAEREAVAPEVHELRWIPLADAVFYTLSTMVSGGTAHHVNAWQAAEFSRLGIKRRDPMFMTACALLEVAGFPSVRSLVGHCAERMGDEAGMQAERERIQWLFPGMTDADVKAGGKGEGGEPSEMVKSARSVLRLRDERAAAAADSAATPRPRL